MRFYIDEMFSAVVAALLRARGVDAVSALELGYSGTQDEVHLQLAAADGRAIVTRNYRHFVELTESFRERQLPHAGVVLVPTSIPSEDFGGLAAAIEAVAGLHPDGLPPYTIMWLSRQAE